MEKKFQSKFKKGILLLNKSKYGIMYKVDCDCGSNECQATISIEYDKELGLITLTFYKNLHFNSWIYSEPGFINYIKKILYRWKTALKIIFTGWLSLESELILIDIDHINNFIEALQEGRDYCIEYQQTQNKSNMVNLKEMNKKTLEL
jgi:hypothetical protein